MGPLPVLLGQINRPPVPEKPVACELVETVDLGGGRKVKKYNCGPCDCCAVSCEGLPDLMYVSFDHPCVGEISMPVHNSGSGFWVNTFAESSVGDPQGTACKSSTPSGWRITVFVTCSTNEDGSVTLSMSVGFNQSDPSVATYNASVSLNSLPVDGSGSASWSGGNPFDCWTCIVADVPLSVSVTE